MAILTFIISNWDSVVFIIVIAAILVILYKRGRTDVIKKILFALVSQAEKEFGGGTGELKKSVVIQWIYEKLPKVVTCFFSPKEIENLIESVLEYAKTKWAANTALNNYVSQTPEIE